MGDRLLGDRTRPAVGSSRARVRDTVHDWILTNYRAEKSEGQPQSLDPPAAGRLAELRAPLLVMIGTIDEPGTAGLHAPSGGEVPRARLETFEDAAHMVNLEQPERFNRLLREFLDANSRVGVPASEPARHG